MEGNFQIISKLNLTFKTSYTKNKKCENPLNNKRYLRGSSQLFEAIPWVINRWTSLEYEYQSINLTV
jgi:hypothetical protein